MAVEVQTSPLPSPWAWRDDAAVFARAAGPVSPEIRGHALNDSGSFLQPRESFLLSGEEEHMPLAVQSVQQAPATFLLVGEPPTPPRSAGGASCSSHHSASTPVNWGAPSPPAAGGGVPLMRQPSGAEQLEMFVDEAFTEMDEALAVAPLGNQSLGVRPSVEEQEWLDQQYDLILECDPSIEGPAYTPEGWSEPNEEEEYVRGLLASHPALDEEEARWLYHRERSQREEGFGGG